MNPIRELRNRAGVTQAELARRAGTSQPTIAAYESGSRSPTLRTLERIARAAGFDMVVTFVPPLTREDRRSLALHHAIAGKLRSEPERVLDRALANLANMRRRHHHTAALFHEWERLLSLPLEDLALAIVDPSPQARELRSVTPFAGVLDAAERADVYRRFRQSEERAA